MLSQSRSHFFRHAKGRSQAAQILVGKRDFRMRHDASTRLATVVICESVTAMAAIRTASRSGGYRLLRRRAETVRNSAIGLWILNTAMVGGWTDLFFRRKRLGLSRAASGAMVAIGTIYVAAASRVDRPATAVGIPVVAWLGFATLLADQVWKRNGAPQVQGQET